MQISAARLAISPIRLEKLMGEIALSVGIVRKYVKGGSGQRLIQEKLSDASGVERQMRELDAALRLKLQSESKRRPENAIINLQRARRLWLVLEEPKSPENRLLRDITIAINSSVMFIMSS